MELSVTTLPLSRLELADYLDLAEVQANDFARQLLSLPDFKQVQGADYQLVFCTVGQLGLEPSTATLATIFERAEQVGYALCPLEVAPFLRIAWLDQPESANNVLSGQNQVPDTSVTVACLPPRPEDSQFPTGFYLRVVEGRPWLRGYRCAPNHLWDENTIFAFVKDSKHP